MTHLLEVLDLLRTRLRVHTIDCTVWSKSWGKVALHMLGFSELAECMYWILTELRVN